MPTPAAPPAASLEIAWEGGLRFGSVPPDAGLLLDGDGRAGPSPVQALLYGLAGCMAIDVVHILQKGRHPLTALRARLTAERAPEAPRRVTRMVLRFELAGDVPEAAVARAIELSRQTYCSVWHSLRQDIVFETSYALEAS